MMIIGSLTNVKRVKEEGVQKRERKMHMWRKDEN